jgi:alpha-mannosidase
MSRLKSNYLLFILVLVLTLSLLTAGCNSHPAPSTPSPALGSNLDAETKALIAQADHVIFLIPFSHWDTDWHATFTQYANLADHNILTAIQLAKKYPRFRYTLEQVLFVQHFWDNYPQYHEDLKALVQSGQITFAWAGITQPETSLDAPAVQVRNLESGKEWISATFGESSLPETAWQSDAFGNSAAFPIFLSQSGIPYLFIGRGRNRCNSDDPNCQLLPLSFYWKSPVTSGSSSASDRVLVDYVPYATAWGITVNRPAIDDQITALHQVVTDQMKRTKSKYLLLPFGFDFYDQPETLPELVDRWNASDKRTILVMSDPKTAFEYLATQDLPEITTDLNPIWQAFYATRPFAKIADKETEFYLTAMDKFSLLEYGQSPLDQTTAWANASINAHYDNIGGVSFDQVWESSQLPRYEQTLKDAASGLAGTLARIASGISTGGSAAGSSPILTVFNPSSWPRSEVIELEGKLLDFSRLSNPVQSLDPDHIAIQVNSVPPVGYLTLTNAQAGEATSVDISNPATVSQTGNQFSLSNGLVSVTLDAEHGGAFSSLSLNENSAQPYEFLSNFGDDIVYWNDSGDVYGAFFGQERARESNVRATITVLASGPLIARLQVEITLGGQEITKTVTLRAGSPLVEVTLVIAALPDTTAIVQTPTVLNTGSRTDDLGFAAFNHPVDYRPIAPGDVTYRREIFYPITYWSDVTANNFGLTLITHGLQGLGGTGTLNLMLVRQVSDQGRDNEGVTDPGEHILQYAYLPHTSGTDNLKPWFEAYAFNQPLIPVWQNGDSVFVQIPFNQTPRTYAYGVGDVARTLPASFSQISAQNGIIADLIRQGDQIQALTINYNPDLAAVIRVGDQQINVPPAAISMTTVILNSAK